MANHVLLNSVDHRDLRIINRRHAMYGDNIWYAMTFPAEFRAAQMCYPIFFKQTENSDQFIAVTLFGFEQGENLYLSENGWQAPYVPMTIQRQPFLIGRQKIMENGMETLKRVMHIDVDDPRVSHSEGELLFSEFGGNTPYLDSMANIMESIHQGLTESEIFFQALIDYELLEPFTLEVELVDTTKHQLIGFHTINEERLNSLSADAIADLHQKLLLEPIYMALGSQRQINTLVVEKNKRVMAGY